MFVASSQRSSKCPSSLSPVASPTTKRFPASSTLTLAPRVAELLRSSSRTEVGSASRVANSASMLDNNRSRSAKLPCWTIPHSTIEVAAIEVAPRWRLIALTLIPTPTTTDSLGSVTYWASTPPSLPGTGPSTTTRSLGHFVKTVEVVS